MSLNDKRSTEATSPPAPVVVTAAIIANRAKSESGPQILIAQRLATSKVEALKWEFPGGKLELFEKPEACLKREIREELNLEIEVVRLFDVVSHVYQGPGNLPEAKLHIVLLCYICRLQGGDLKMLEVANAKWIEREQLNEFEFAAADVPLVERLKKEGLQF